MRVARGLALAFAALACLPREARAMGAVVSPDGGAIAMTNARIAVSVSTGYTTRWVQIATTRAPGGFEWLLPLAAGARVDLADDAWLDALDAATVPVIRPPSTPSGCAGPFASFAVSPSTSPSSVSPSQAFLATSATTLAEAASQGGWTLPDAVANDLSATFDAGGAVLTLTYPSSDLPTHTLRIMDGAPANLPVALSSGTEGVAVTAFVVGSAPFFANAPSLSLDPANVVWLAGGESTYASAVATLVSSAEGSWLEQDTEATSFFAATVPAPGVSLPSVVAGYFHLAVQYGETSSDEGACAAASQAVDAGGPFAPSCTAGAFAIVPGASPCVPAAEGRTSPLSLVCGAAIEAAIAVGTLTPSAVWVSRMTADVTNGTDVGLVSVADAESPVVVAGSTEDSCGVEVDGGLDASGAWEDEGGFEDGGNGGDDGGDPSGAPSGGDASIDDGGGGPEDDDIPDVTEAASSGCGSSSGDDEGGSSGCSDDSGNDDSSNGCSSDTNDKDDTNSCSTTSRRRHGKTPVESIVLAIVTAVVVKRRFRAVRS